MAAPRSSFAPLSAPGDEALVEIHPGHDAAFVLDPDGSDIEAVCHGRAARSADSVKVTF